MRDLEDLQEKATATAVKAKAGKYLTFKLDDEDFGFEILKVQEIIGLIRITSVPQSSHNSTCDARNQLNCCILCNSSTPTSTNSPTI